MQGHVTGDGCPNPKLKIPCTVGSPAAGARVSFQPVAGGSPLRTSTDSAGAHSITLPAGTYLVWAGGPETCAANAVQCAGQRVTLQPGEARTLDLSVADLCRGPLPPDSICRPGERSLTSALIGPD